MPDDGLFDHQMSNFILWRRPLVLATIASASSDVRNAHARARTRVRTIPREQWRLIGPPLRCYRAAPGRGIGATELLTQSKLANHVSPTLEVFPESLGHSLRGAAGGLHAHLPEPILHFRQLQDRGDFTVELVNN